MLLKSATDIIDRLYKFASRIRNPATRLASAKAKAFKNVDAETGVELYENFETQIDPQHINEVFSEYRHKGAPGDDAQSDDSEKADQLEDLTEADRTLIARFAKANTDRRRQFGYWRRHRVKNTRETIKALEEVAKMPDFAPSLGKMPIAISNVLPPPTSKLYSRPSTATQLLLDPSKFNFNDTASTRSSHTIAPKAQNAKDEQVDVPEVPSSLKGQDNFSCPYCFTLCSKSILEKERWRYFILLDIICMK